MAWNVNVFTPTCKGVVDWLVLRCGKLVFAEARNLHPARGVLRMRRNMAMQHELFVVRVASRKGNIRSMYFWFEMRCVSGCATE
jgi:hypothetical protein